MVAGGWHRSVLAGGCFWPAHHPSMVRTLGAVRHPRRIYCCQVTICVGLHVVAGHAHHARSWKHGRKHGEPCIRLPAAHAT